MICSQQENIGEKLYLIRVKQRLQIPLKTLLDPLTVCAPRSKRSSGNDGPIFQTID